MKNIDGILSIADKIWFNNKNKCRLRICGWTKEQIKQLKTAEYVDLTIVPDETGQRVHIQITTKKDIEKLRLEKA